MIKGIIFDMDGVIIDSSPVLYKVWNELFKKHFNIEIDKKEFASQFGKNGIHFTEYFFKKYNIKMPHEKFYRLMFSGNESIRKEIGLKKGVKKQLEILKKDYKIALATGAPKQAGLETLKRFNIINYFDFVIGGDCVEEAKPNPEIFLRAADALGLSNKNCVVVEDAILGIMAAKAAKMVCIVVEDEFTKYQDHSLADYKIKTMNELKKTIDLIQKNYAK